MPSAHWIRAPVGHFTAVEIAPAAAPLSIEHPPRRLVQPHVPIQPRGHRLCEANVRRRLSSTGVARSKHFNDFAQATRALQITNRYGAVQRTARTIKVL